MAETYTKPPTDTDWDTTGAAVAEQLRGLLEWVRIHADDLPMRFFHAPAEFVTDPTDDAPAFPGGASHLILVAQSGDIGGDDFWYGLFYHTPGNAFYSAWTIPSPEGTTRILLNPFEVDWEWDEETFLHPTALVKALVARIEEYEAMIKEEWDVIEARVAAAESAARTLARYAA